MYFTGKENDKAALVNSLIIIIAQGVGLVGGIALGIFFSIIAISEGENIISSILLYGILSSAMFGFLGWFFLSFVVMIILGMFDTFYSEVRHHRE